jgi:hypothetical protein
MQAVQPVVVEAANVQKEEKAADKSMQEVTGNMVEALSKSSNPKHRNCKFLKFLNKLNSGAYTIENEQLVKHPEKLAEFRAQDVARRDAE